MSRQERIDDLRRRILEDPASIAFAQLVEEYRRGGDREAAVHTCRSGLLTHPDYLSARVTVGRALVELGAFDEAGHALEQVLTAEPNNVGAIRGLGELHLARGRFSDAQACFERALALAPYDADLERLVAETGRLVREADAAAGTDEAHEGRAEQTSLAGRLGDGDVTAGNLRVGRPSDGASPMTDEERVAPLVRMVQTIATLEDWLSAIYVARTNRSA